jgi:two-component system phosphate regulon sensor histidine kinase PhoR
MAEGLVLLNQKRVILSINPSAMRLFGTDNSCVGKFILSVHRDPALQELLLRSGEGVHGESVLELGSGVYQVDASPVISDGQVSGTVLLMMDVTEKQRSEQMRREFTANVSHELKTPLHTISGCAELMANGVVKPEDMNRFSTQIYSEAQRMVRLVDDIIRLSHLDEGADDLKREEVDLYALAEQTVGSLLPVANEAQVQLTLEGETAVMNGIPQLLQGILYNLCDNGIKYNRPGGTVAVTVQNEGQSVRLTVADTGIGIPAEHQERIFERFYRVDKSHSKEIGGTGLGLSIVKHAARLHNASIELISEPGKGTTITVTFPAKYDYVE